MPIKPLVVCIPETTRIIERTFVERHTDPLPVIHIEVPASPPAPHITVNVPERSNRERQSVPEQIAPTHDKASPEEKRGSAPEVNAIPEADTPAEQAKPEHKTLAPEPEKRSPEEQKNAPPADRNNSPTNDPELFDELFAPDTPASQADLPEFEKIGPGRQRRYEELGKDDVEPVRELVLFRNEFAHHWPGLSRDMENYYERFYFTAPNKRKDGKDYAKHVKCWERRTKWLSAAQSAPDSQ